MRELLYSFLYDSRDRVLGVLNTLVGLSIFIVVALLIFENGFYMAPEEEAQIQKGFNAIFGFFVFQYLVKFLYSFERIKFVKSTWIECLLITVLLSTAAYHFALGGTKGSYLLSYFFDSSYERAYNLLISVYMIYFVGFNFVKLSAYLQSLTVQPSTTLAFSFIFLISAGTGLLMLPKMSVGEAGAPFLDAFFTSVSASCVTGLIVVDTATYFTFKGQMVILFLIQFGGIGIVTFATFFATMLSNKMGIREQQMIQDFLSGEDLSSAKRLLRRVLGMTVLIELIAAVGIFIGWDYRIQFESLGEKIFYSVFHSVSAFCNAGFSLFTNGLAERFVSNSLLVHGVIALAIIMGGLGFSTIQDLFAPSVLRERMRKPWIDWKISTKIAVHGSVVLIILGTAMFYWLEKDNLGTIGRMSGLKVLITSFFQSVTTRTAGFNTVDIGRLTTPTLIIFIFLMFIGASSGSTGGGIKTSTFVIITSSALATITGKTSVQLGGRSVTNELLFRAFTVFIFACTFNIVMIFLLAVFEPDIPIMQLVFEEVSAFCTVGLSTGITAELSTASKYLLIVCMFIGRIGTLTLAFAISSRVSTNRYKYPKASLMVG